MPNPYDDIFDNGKGHKRQEKVPEKISYSSSDDILNDDHAENQKEPLGEVLDKIKVFNEKADSFSQLLSQLRAIDHKEQNHLLRHFLVTKDKHKKHSLSGEKRYYEVLLSKFEKVLVPMRDLAHLHYKTVQQFNRDIGKDYYSFDKTDRVIETEKSMAMDGIILQRRILADAAESLGILVEGMKGTERRMKEYINVGGQNNISLSEYEITVQKRTLLTNGATHRFDYTFFNTNLLDKTALSLGIYVQETTSQYIGKLRYALEL